MKIVCVYHSIDLDGWMSAAIVKHWFNEENNTKENLARVNPEQRSPINTLDFIDYNYGDPIPDLSQYDRVIMVDCSFKLTTGPAIARIFPMVNLYHRFGNNFIWIDRHEIIKEVPFEINGLRANIDISGNIQKIAACELTWNYFFPNEPMPEIVRLLGMYDCFRHKGTKEKIKILHFQFGARAVITDYIKAYEYLEKSIKGVSSVWNIETVLEIDGKTIYKYLLTEAQSIYKTGFTHYFVPVTNIEDKATARSFKFLCINRERFNSINYKIDYHKDGYDGVASFHFDGKANLWRFSLYNDNGLVDCAEIAKRYNGGGHKGASGFVVKDLKQVFNII